MTGSVGSIAFFALFFLYLWLYVDLRFLSGGGGIATNFPVYFKGWEFFRDFLGRPGGPVEYLAAILCQLFYIGWAGALVVTVQAWLMSACAGYILRSAGWSGLQGLRFVPPIVLLVTYTHYTFHFVTHTSFLAALLFTCLYFRTTIRPASNYTRVALFLALSVILYYAAAGAYMLFALLCAMHELLFQKRPLPGLSYLLSAAAIPYVVGVSICGVSTVSAFSDLLPFSWKILSYEGRRKLISAAFVLYLFLPLIVIAAGLWRSFLGPGIHARLSLKRKKSKRRMVLRILRPVIESLALLGIASAAVFFSHDAQRRTLSAVHYYACRGMWPDVLRAARRYPDHSLVVNAVNRALYHTGRLGYDMFGWPQRPDVLMQTGKDQILAYWQKFDTQLDLGLMNMAEKNMTECMEVLGEHPLILQRLALINMVKANYDSAEIYLGKLSKTLFHSNWANDYLTRLQGDPNLSKDQRIQRLRSVCIKTDDPTNFFSREKTLCDLLEQNGSNRMAFEYLATWYLLTKQSDKLTRMIEHLKDYGYKEIPRLYEEALLIHVYATREVVDLGSYQATPAARQRIERFSHVFNTYKRNKQAAYGELAKDYGDSYFFYQIYGFSGVGK